ncbi:LD-carboxypeptidase [bacterium]|nr:LD-carboxypeptidase [bacterium]
MKTIKPKKLKKGDIIGIIAVSGRIKELNNIENAAKYFESQGYKTEISDTCKTYHRYMAGTSDDDCVNTLHDFFENPDIDAILCARGGYGTLRLLDKIDWSIIKKNPKIFAGYSDITILLNMIYKKTGLITFHSAMANGDFGGNIEEYTKTSFFDTLQGKKEAYSAEKGTTLLKGETQGILWGGNLATLVSLCGTDFVPDNDLIIFIEDLNEPVYKIDKMLTQLFNVEKISKNVKGIAFGEFKDIEDTKTLEEVQTEIVKKYNIPACTGFKITHNKIKDTIPVGIMAELNTEKRIIKIKETYFK